MRMFIWLNSIKRCDHINGFWSKEETNSRKIWHYMTFEDNPTKDHETGWINNNNFNLIVWIWIEIMDWIEWICCYSPYFFVIKKQIFQFCEWFNSVKSWMHLFLILLIQGVCVCMCVRRGNSLLFGKECHCLCWNNRCFIIKYYLRTYQHLRHHLPHTPNTESINQNSRNFSKCIQFQLSSSRLMTI